MLPPASDHAALRAVPFPPLLAPFDPNQLQFDYFWELGPLLHFNAAVNIAPPRPVRITRAASGSLGFLLSGNRPVACVA